MTVRPPYEMMVAWIEDMREERDLLKDRLERAQNPQFPEGCERGEALSRVIEAAHRFYVAQGHDTPASELVRSEVDLLQAVHDLRVGLQMPRVDWDGADRPVLPDTGEGGVV